MTVAPLYIRIAALFMSILSALVLRNGFMLHEYAVSWFAAAFNLVFVVEFAALTVFGRSPAMGLMHRLRHYGGYLIIALRGLNILAAAGFLAWALVCAAKTHASADIVITLIQLFFLAAVAVALYINSRCYRENSEARIQNLLLITGITYAVSVFMAARLLQGSVIMPWTILTAGMGNIVLAVLAMVVMNPSEH